MSNQKVASEERARGALPDVVRLAASTTRTWHAGASPGLTEIRERGLRGRDDLTIVARSFTAEVNASQNAADVGR